MYKPENFDPIVEPNNYFKNFNKKYEDNTLSGVDIFQWH